MIILDTNAVSELMRPVPDPSVVAWARSHTGAELNITAITLAEIGYGLERMPVGRRRAFLTAAAGELFATFGEQILPFDSGAATHYPGVVAGRDRRGLPIEIADAQIAAICHTHRATLATRNTKDFTHTGVELVDPWRPN